MELQTWDDIPQTFDNKRKTLLVIDVEALPQAITISNLSWHRQLVDIQTNFLSNEPYKARLEGCHLIIRIGHEAAVYRDPCRSTYKSLMVFEPSNREGGYLRSKPKLTDEVKQRLKAMFFVGLAASLMEESTTSLAKLGEYQVRQALFNALRWPCRFAACYTTAEGGLSPEFAPSLFDVEHRTDVDPILIAVNTGRDATETKSIFMSMKMDTNLLARQIVTWGPEDCLSIIPTASYGGIRAVDVEEIEGLRKVADQIGKYIKNEENSRPLSIAVFGQPGSGKSFGIKEVAKSILQNHGYKGEDTRPLEFNVSLMTDKADLVNAFEKIREKHFSRKVPIVLFDEFDSSNQIWLEHFLKRMEEGRYEDIDRKTSRPIGRGIYAFIGGTSKTWEEFQRHRCEPPRASGFIGERQWVVSHGQQAERLRIIAKYYTCDFESPACPKLSVIFQNMRDTALEGHLPIVFFRNFNTGRGTKWGLLKSFLAPMQDALFRDNGHDRRIGQGMFVFVERPDTEHTTPKGPRDEGYQSSNFIQAKGPDFVSRLRGHVTDNQGHQGNTINVRPLKKVIDEYLLSPRNKPLSLCITTNVEVSALKEGLGNLYLDSPEVHPGNQANPVSPANSNPRKMFVEKIAGHVDVVGPNPVPRYGEGNVNGDADWNHMAKIRRAILLRSVLERRLKEHLKGKKQIKFEPKVLNALLNTREFYHGVRSLEAILEMSALSNYTDSTGFLWEYLPTDQLSLHVDKALFYGAANSNIDPPKEIEPRIYTEKSIMSLQVGLPLPTDR
ncbi:hypothetical protein N8T08_008137 [Aspergillus melleus]|uniref:Uncharacterized protein n=1 Tax=Aspergillus melleus TaxID=138277 RepID=A0ACC3AX97_9EURO|nr:hypothetical protein N8T08_008137 [Aspergillus melleus]